MDNCKCSLIIEADIRASIKTAVNMVENIAGHPIDDVLKLARNLGWGVSGILSAYYHGKELPGSAKSEADQDVSRPLDLNIQHKKDGPVTAADLAANHYILEHLQAELGHDAFGYLSEETYKASSDGQPFPQEWVWIIDPLDGTRDFIDKTGEYAFHLALTHQGRPVLTVVACPEVGRLYYATLGGGAFVKTSDGQTQRLHVSQKAQLSELTVVVSRTHRDDRFKTMLSQLPCQNQLCVGSVGGKVSAIADQRADVYISLSGKSAPKDWDMAAPELILTEAGGKFTHADGSPLRYNTGDVHQWGCLIASNGPCHSELCATATQLLAEIDAKT